MKIAICYRCSSGRYQAWLKSDEEFKATASKLGDAVWYLIEHHINRGKHFELVSPGAIEEAERCLAFAVSNGRVFNLKKYARALGRKPTKVELQKCKAEEKRRQAEHLEALNKR
jgi:hypothetical protein